MLLDESKQRHGAYQREDGYRHPVCLDKGIPSLLSDYACEPHGEEYQEPKPLISNTNVAWEEWLEVISEGEYQDDPKGPIRYLIENRYLILCW